VTETEESKKAGSGKRDRSLPSKNDAVPAPPVQKPVGKGSTPIHTRFKPGESGNPGGRPRGSKNIRHTIFDKAMEKITVTTQNGKEQMTMQDAIARKIYERMLHGDFKFCKLYIELEREVEKERAEEEKKKEQRKPIDGLHRFIESLNHPIPAPGYINIDDIPDDEVREWVRKIYNEREARVAEENVGKDESGDEK